MKVRDLIVPTVRLIPDDGGLMESGWPRIESVRHPGQDRTDSYAGSNMFICSNPSQARSEIRP